MSNETDLEPLEPLEPLDPEETGAGTTREQARARADGAEPGRWPGGRAALVVLAGAVVIWIAAVSFTAISRDPPRRTEPERASVPTGTAPSPAPPTTTPSFGSDPFGVASGRFAAVVDGRLFIVDAARREVRGIAGVARARIVAISGSSVLVQSDDPAFSGRRYIVGGRSGQVDSVPDGTWLPRIGGGWWVAADGALLSESDRALLPVGAVALAEVNGGFVVAPTDGAALSLWDPRTGARRPLGRSPNTRLLGADANRVALAGPRCPSPTSPKCSIDLVDVVTGRVDSIPVPFSDQFVRNEVFSPDGRRMAIWGTSGVSLHDTATGAALRTFGTLRPTSLPLTFTADARSLLVLEGPAQYRQVIVLRAEDGGFVRSWVSAQPLEQLVALREL